VRNRKGLQRRNPFRDSNERAIARLPNSVNNPRRAPKLVPKLDQVATCNSVRYQNENPEWKPFFFEKKNQKTFYIKSLV
jgi:hypothetical protein